VSRLRQIIGYVGIPLLPVFSLSSCYAPPAEVSLALQINNDLRRAIEINLTTKNYRVWSSSGYTPHDIFENIRALGSAHAIAQLCQELAALRSQDLALFEKEIRASSSLFPPSSECANGGKTDLLRKIQSHWSKTAQQFRIKNPTASLRNRLANFKSSEKPIDLSRSSTIGSQELGPSEVALVFHEGPYPGRTEAILNILNEAGVRAHFFQTAEKSRSLPEITQRATQEGHILGSQGQISQVLWNIDSGDYRLRNPQELLDHALQQVLTQKGGVVLFHDHFEQTVIALPAFLKALQDQNFKTAVFIPGNKRESPKLASNPQPDRRPLNVKP
jgi:peptidoglycan/xylan/chitin deacetylase (PgdA/CDA1 family)